MLLSGAVTWRTIPERSPWWGGFWESLIKSTKSSLKKVLGRAYLDIDPFRTLIKEIEMRINERPLTVVNDDREDKPLRPIDLIRSPGFSASDQLSEVLKDHQKHFQQAWCVWRTTYLQSLRQWKNQKNKEQDHSTIQVGDIVLMEPSTKISNRALFPIAKVEQLIPGKDGFVRAAVVLCKGQLFRRTTKLLYPIEANVEVNVTPIPVPIVRPIPMADDRIDVPVEVPAVVKKSRRGKEIIRPRRLRDFTV
jgi:hypothetical protein